MTYGIAMGALGNVVWNWTLVPPAMGILLVAGLCFIAGKMQQFYKQADERERAFIEGYNLATTSLFSLATRASKAVEAPALMQPPPKPETIRGVVKIVGKHAVTTGEVSTMQQTRQFTAWDEFDPAA